jgi:hypothetical protein
MAWQPWLESFHPKSGVFFFGWENHGKIYREISENGWETYRKHIGKLMKN